MLSDTQTVSQQIDHNMHLPKTRFMLSIPAKLSPVFVEGKPSRKQRVMCTTEIRLQEILTHIQWSNLWLCITGRLLERFIASGEHPHQQSKQWEVNQWLLSVSYDILKWNRRSTRPPLSLLRWRNLKWSEWYSTSLYLTRSATPWFDSRLGWKIYRTPSRRAYIDEQAISLVSQASVRQNEHRGNI